MISIMLILAVLGTVVVIAVWLIYQHESQGGPTIPVEPAQHIFSPDRNLQAVIRSRLGGTFQMEIRHRRLDESPDTGPSETWDLVYGPVIVASMEEATDVANQRFRLLDTD